MQPPDLPPLADVILRLAGLFEQLGVPYAIGVAVAVSFWGVPRPLHIHLRFFFNGFAFAIMNSKASIASLRVVPCPPFGCSIISTLRFMLFSF